MTYKGLLYTSGNTASLAQRIPCKTRPDALRRGLLAALMLFGVTPLCAQQREADLAWNQGHYEAARAGYEQVLRQNPSAARANLRIGIILSWQGKLDSALTFIARARAADPTDIDMRLAQARVRSWNKQYDGALALYDSVLAQRPDLREAELGNAQTLSWAGRLNEAKGVYRAMIARNSSDRDARLGQAQVSAWQGDLSTAEHLYRAILTQNPRDADALAGLGYVYYWQGRETAARKQVRAALTVDSTNKAGRALHRTIQEATRPATEGTANWSNDSDHNTSFWQTLSGSGTLGAGVGVFGSVNALETSDPTLDATRVGGEAGVSLGRGRVQLSGAAGARRLDPGVADPRTAATYRGRLGYRPVPGFGLSVGYSRSPFDEIASLMERDLDLELLEGGLDARPFAGLSIYAAGSGLWLSDGNSRTGVLGGLTQKLNRRFSVGLFGRTLSYARRGVGYFSPDRFSVLEATAGYSLETRFWTGSLGGGLGAQQVGKRGSAQSEWHVEGRVGRRWGIGNRVELFGLVTNSAVSSTSGAFR
ncbi:MAG: tetratricopeptide repeat protein, partial [Gemmatimonadales bacterium]